eukprot:TRINITY_DN8142_c0_g1_i10.p1 TRINITY_DN8142_c0_g1~~TRINITY_DN8142_c0_g1_i10.p1  ORF type:complete len:632 (+),score=218.65 TRINITY_DN8142_c0_g1_i10:154-2049(+)
MDELEELQRMLQDVQSEVEAHKFSERNIVELMERLVEIERLDILHSMNGKEYLTSEHLGAEIMRELQRNGGRLSTIELPKLLDVSGDHINKQIDILIKKDKRKLLLVNDSLMTRSYLDTLASTIASSLAERGSIFISEISSGHDLPLDFLKIEFAEWIDRGKVKGKMHGEIVYNDSHIRRQKCRIRGFVMGTTRPVAVSQAASDLKMEERLFSSLLDELIKSNEVKVKLQSDLIIPACFEHAQKGIVLSFFSQNHYIEYSKLNKIMIRKQKEYLKSLNLEGTHLSTVFVDNSLIAQIDSFISDTLSSDQLFDLHTQVPDCFTEDDIKGLIGDCPSGSKATLLDHYVAGPKFTEVCFDSLKKLAAEYAKTVRTGKKEAKKKTASPKKKKKAKQDAEAEEEKFTFPFSEDIAYEELKKCEKVIKDGLNEDEEFLRAFVEFFYSDIRETYENAYREYMKARSQPNKIDPNEFKDIIQKEFDKLLYALKSLDIIEKLLNDSGAKEEFKKMENTINVHLSKKKVNPLLNYIVVHQLAYSGVNFKELIKDKQVPLLTTQERESLIKRVPKELISIFTDLNKLAISKSVKDFVDALLEQKANIAVALRPPDKKADKAAKSALIPVSYTHLTLPTICSV